MLIIISTIVAWPIAYYIMRDWLDNFAYRVDISLFVFLSASVLAFIIAFFIVGYRAYAAATTNPSKSLRDE